jgi:arylsulfatase
MAYTFDKANAEAPSRRSTQYFEMFGMRALYHEGWIASTTPYRAPWEITLPTPKDVVNGVKWELYNIAEDWTQFDDLAAANPAKLEELQDLFWVEASKYQVLPLDASGFSRYLIERPSSTAGRAEFTYLNPVTGILPGNEPNGLNKSYVIAAEVTVPAGGGDGMLVTEGGRFGGYGLYLLKGRPVLLYHLLGLARYRWEGAQALTPGSHNIAFHFEYDGPGAGKGGTGVLAVDGAEVARRTIPNSVPIAFGVDESFDVGSDTGTPVADDDYRVPFAFNGTLSQLTIKLEPLQLSPADQKAVQDANGKRD